MLKSNSSPIDELGNWCQQRLVGAQCKYEAQQGGFHGDSVSGNQPCQRPPTSTVTLKELQWKYLPNTVLTYLGLTSNKGGKDRVVNLLVKHFRKSTVMAKQKKMANKVDSSALGRANPYGHPTYRFVAKTTGCIDSRLTLP